MNAVLSLRTSGVTPDGYTAAKRGYIVLLKGEALHFRYPEVTGAAEG